MQVGTTKDQGLYNKPSAAVHPGALAAGTLPQYIYCGKYKFELNLEASHILIFNNSSVFILFNCSSSYYYS